ncbi:MAG: UvrD-helicase domain-containing protein, partial [Bacteroidales bacterium]|nr:UvrD-helicase domain-containing protein [Bacteroidales bacterium]
MSKLKVIKASAGSGKTFNLALEYIKILVNEYPHYYRHVLAVTFTNKATAEMKDRILRELHMLGDNQSSDFLNILLEETNLTEHQIRNRSATILQNILHGYTWFRIETIDTFFQQIIRSFTRELGIFNGYELELNSEKILMEAIDRLIDGVNDGSEISKLVVEYLFEKIQEGKSWNFKDNLLAIGKELQKESLNVHQNELEEIGNQVKDFSKSMDEQLAKIKNRIVEIGKQGCEQLEQQGLSVDDIFQRGRGPAGFFEKTANKGPAETIGSYVYKAVASADIWAPKSSKMPQGIIQLAINSLIPLLKESIEQHNLYHSLMLVKKHVFSLMLVSGIQREVNNVCDAKNLFLITNSNPFLFRIIDNNDAPFIYEKTGNQFHHFLIDEFQDTSVLQWRNFNPLISNSLSLDKDCLLVGDVKQAIYRWRNSEWEILGYKVKEQYRHQPGVLMEKSLDTNWRSNQKVVEFNNSFFKQLALQLDNEIGDANEEAVSLQELYSDVEQNVSPKNTNGYGYVESTLIEKKELEEDENYLTNWLVDKVNQVLDEGYMPGDIALLIRQRAEGVELANLIIKANKEQRFRRNVQIMSNESLWLESSIVVRIIVSVLTWLFDKKNM